MLTSSMRYSRWLVTALVIWVCLPLQQATASPLNDLRTAFLNPPDDSRIMMRWWWFGPAVTKAELEREMRLMKEGGIGGFEVQPVYPLSLDDESKGIRTFPFLSAEFLDALRFTADKARELGLRFDLTLGSGWPFGGPTVTIEHAAARLRYERVKVDSNPVVKVPSIGAGEKLLAVFLARVDNTTLIGDSIREIKEIKDGAVHLSALPAGSHEVLFFISSRSGMQVKRPAVGGEGFVLDHMNRAATETYLKTVGDRLLSTLGPNRPYAIFCDSLEVYNSDWSNDFLEEFQRRRGYDLKPQLPALVTDMGWRTKALRRDWGKTLTELLNERFLAPMQDWSNRNQTKFRIQGYGVPSAAISSNAHADLPEGEGAQWKVVRASRWASSASHLYGRPVASSETWTWLHSPSFRATPLDIKAEADVHFLQGINQLIGHGWPYTAPGVEYPGWRFYAAGVFNEMNPWWIVMPDVAKYLQRVSFMMRQGQPVNDVALYLPNDDGWSHMNPGNPHLIEVLREHVGPELMPEIFKAGYNLDFFDADALNQVGKVEGAALVLGRNRYKIVILPAVETIPIDTYRKLEEFVKGGGVLVATRQLPSKAPGFLATPENHQQIEAMSKQLFEGQGARAHFVSNEATQLGRTLHRLVKPDIEFLPGNTGDIGFVHRRTADAEIYFIANSSNTGQPIKASFRVAKMKPEWWNPFDGSVTPAKDESGSLEFSTVSLDLEPYGSRLLVFSKPGPWSEDDRKKTQPDQLDISADWRVSIGESPASNWTKLHSWADDEATRYFSGRAFYEKTVNVPSSFIQNEAIYLNLGEGIPITPQPLRNGMRAWLEGPIREAAVVYINNNRVGSVWCPPYRIEVKRFLRAGENRIRIEVANTAMNHMAGRSLPDYRLLSLRYGERFQPQDMDKVQPIPSGLLGPIHLVARSR